MKIHFVCSGGRGNAHVVRGLTELDDERPLGFGPMQSKYGSTEPDEWRGNRRSAGDAEKPEMVWTLSWATHGRPVYTFHCPTCGRNPEIGEAYMDRLFDAYRDRGEDTPTVDIAYIPR